MMSPTMVRLLKAVAKAYLTRRKIDRLPTAHATSYFRMRKQAQKTYRRIRMKTSDPLLKIKR